MKGGMVKINKKYSDDVENILLMEEIDEENFKNKGIDDIFNDLQKGGFIVPVELDEVLLLKTMHFKIRYANNYLSLAILPTLECNFNCVYCYEKEKKGVISDKVCENILNFVKKQSKEIKLLTISWYGGEPLLYFDKIANLSEEMIKICNEQRISYNASLITNGYLLDNYIPYLERYKIHKIQVTLDGPPEIHDKRRKTLQGNGTYHRILENIKETLTKTENIIFHIRINIDKENLNYIPNFIEILANDPVISKYKNRVFPYPGIVSEYGNTCIDTSICFSLPAEYKRIVLTIYPIIIKHFKTRPSTQPKFIGCGAISPQHYCIGPDGYIWKCWAEVGDYNLSIGKLDKNGKISISNHNLFLKWLTYDPIEQCKRCKFLPQCMGGCYYYPIHTGKIKCNWLKFVIPEIGLILSRKRREKKC